MLKIVKIYGRIKRDLKMKDWVQYLMVMLLLAAILFVIGLFIRHLMFR